MEEGAHVCQFCTLYAEVGLILSQTLLERAVHEVVDQLVEVQAQLCDTHSLVEGADAFLLVDPEETHVAVLHQILQLILIALDGFVLLPDSRLVLLVLEVEFSLLGDVADGEGDEDELSLVVMDRVQA